MAKILISFLGTGALKANVGKNQRRYREATYQFDDGERIETSFVAEAISKHYKIDRIILIGTVKSMWEEVYEVFSRKNGLEIDMDYGAELIDYCERADHLSDLEIPDLTRIEQAIGHNSEVILIHYGLNQKELDINAARILEIERLLHHGDELIVDITHAFRSLPLYLMSMLTYLKNVSPKKIQISHILYGMLDVSKELKYAPIVDLNEIMKINDWITGAYSFKEFGNAYKISELLKQEGENEVAQRLKEFSDVFNLNHITSIRNQIQKISAIKKRKFNSTADPIISPVIKDFLAEFQFIKEDSEFQCKLAKWHFDHKNYSSSYLVLSEAIITYVCECEHLDWKDKNTRDEMKITLKSRKRSEILQAKNIMVIRDNYLKINNIRNGIAHTKETKEGCGSLKEILRDSLVEVSKVIIGA